MNWTALRSASASHLPRSVPTMSVSPFACLGGLQSNRDHLSFASYPFTTASAAAIIERMAKHYDQYCPAANALDVVGDRWALLVARELMQGPKRYTDLAEGLPGIGTNILAARLRDLETAGVITKKTLPPPAASRVYELTDYGLELKPVMRELALWGARSLGPPTAGRRAFPRLARLPGRHDPRAARTRRPLRVPRRRRDRITRRRRRVHRSDRRSRRRRQADAEGLYYLFIERRLDGVRSPATVPCSTA